MVTGEIFHLASILLYPIYRNLAARVNTVSMQTRAIQTGKVYLVGAGPGDADLLTVKALRLIQNCDVILYDKLVSDDIQALFPAGCKKFFVGKSMSNHSIPQEQLNKLMVTFAKKGLVICRLKGGDPFVFGRGSEEMLVLHKADVTTEVVPGITAASGCTSYAGIPLTHRGVSQGCTFITGHAEKTLELNWSSLASVNHTLVFYMGLSQLAHIAQQLTLHGLCKNTPVALIENGSQLSQRVFMTNIDQMTLQADQHSLVSPTLIVIGQVVKYREQLAWFENLPREQENQTLPCNSNKKTTRLSA